MSDPDYMGALGPLARMEGLSAILRLAKEVTGLRFAAVAKVTENQWVAVAVADSVPLDIRPGDERPVASTLCNEVRLRRRSLVYGESMRKLQYAGYAAQVHFEQRGLHSHISVPILTADGRFVGTLCGIDPLPIVVEKTSVVETLELFARLIANHLDLQARLESSQSELGASVETGRLREEFVAVLGHDLRTPISAIRLSADLLEPRVADPRSKTLVGAIRTSALRMAALIDDVLDFARCRLGSRFAVNLKRVDDLFTALEPVIAEIRAAHPNADITYRHGAPQPLLCDFGRVSQLVSNLLSNAVKHGAPGGPIVIEGSVERHDLLLSFANLGEAIPAEQMELLFEPFTRADGEHKSEGLGLGLYICSQIAESHGGSLKVSSDEQLTRFIARLPILAHTP
jgi:signal transduction histidine kinase